MKIYYSIVEEIEVDDALSDEQIDDFIAEKSDGKSYMWSKEDNILD